ncbi:MULTISPECIES: RraA family protein [Marinovum]|jgi:4-hydroxy-4-methyl-2-oxoglutarate aldolase|uniref:RraA family protein n=1 Tax=Marinovum TaxID=367771 RepID=UPI00237B23E5|nr:MULTISPECIES: RraA family protein [Marinovum]MDD9743670.1 RraA family protein [Marinovum sp. PR37]
MTAQDDLSDVETATLGHFLESGFMAPALQALLPERRIFGPALTVRMPGDDGSILVEALSRAEPGQVIVIDRCGDLRHACWGAVTTCAAKARGVVGTVIDGFVTDRSAILAEDFPVWCRGRSPVTTKPRRLGGAVNVTINCGGVAVRPGELVLADESGVVVIPPGEAEAHIRRARQMQAEERLLLARLRAGETLADITRAA